MKKPSMTKKTYIRAAELLRDQYCRLPDAQRAVAVELLCALFQDDNPRFDVERFREACCPVAPTLRARHNTRRRPA